jgi:hypothetical protein
MNYPKKLNEYVHFITIIYGGTMRKEGIIECIMANTLAYANEFVSRTTYRGAEKHFVNLLKNIS